LRREEYETSAPGQLMNSIQGHLTFLPAPLPPTLSYDLNMVRLLSEADHALGELAGVGQMLPNPHLLIRPFLRREAVSSSRIEGTITRLDQVFLFEAKPDELHHPGDVEEVINHVHALELGLERIRQGRPLTLRLLREVHARLLQGVRGENKRPGEFRKCGVMIGRHGQTFAEARFVPPCHTAIDDLMNDFERFTNTERSLPIVVLLALAHYQFEAIHPFMDGNGRLGRLLITLLLCERQKLPQPLLYLSAYFERHDEEYKDRMLEVSRRAAWGEWISFFARGVAEQSADAATRARRLLALQQQYRQRAAAVSSSVTVIRLVEELFASPFITIPGAASSLSVTFPTAQNSIEKLVEVGILREITGQARNRVYCADGVLRLLEEGPVPPESQTSPPPAPAP